MEKPIELNDQKTAIKGKYWQNWQKMNKSSQKEISFYFIA